MSLPLLSGRRALGLPRVSGRSRGWDFTNALPAMEPETEAYIARLTEQPSPYHAAALDDLMLVFKDIGLAKFSRVLVKRTHTAQAGLTNFVGAGVATLVGSPVFTPNAGFAGNGTSAAIDSGVKLTQQDSGHLSFWSRTAGQHGNVDMGNSNSLLLCRTTANTASHRVNSGTSGTSGGSITDGTGFYVTSRLGPAGADNVLYRNGVVVGATPGVSAAPDAAANIRILGRGGTLSWSIRECAYATIGLGLTAAEVTKLYNGFKAYDDAMAAIQTLAFVMNDEQTHYATYNGAYVTSEIA